MSSGSIDLAGGVGTGASSPTGAAGGDLSGNYPDPGVATVGGATAANIATATTLVNGAQSGNKVLASPANGSSGAPAFRALVGADLPALSGDVSNSGATVTVNQVTHVIGQALSTTNRLALTPSNGQMVYDTTLSCLFIYNVSRWFPASVVDPVSGFLISEDWANNNVAGNTAWSVTGNTGSNSGMLFDSNQNAVGQAFIEQADPGPGYATLYYGNSYALGAQVMFFDARVYVSALSTGAQEYIASVGFGDQVDATLFTEGIYFEYDRATDGDFWTCKTTSSSTTTKTVTAVAPTAGTYQTLSVGLYGGSVKFYINGTLVATHSTNITTALIAPKLRIIKTVGSTARRLVNDFFTTYSFFTTRRT